MDINELSSHITYSSSLSSILIHILYHPESYILLIIILILPVLNLFTIDSMADSLKWSVDQFLMLFTISIYSCTIIPHF